MKTKLISAILCFAMLTLLFSGCKPNNKNEGSGSNNEGNENQNPSCTHNYVEGICGICGESDPNYAPDDDSENKEEEKPEEEDNSKIPPINTDGETELPFVPAK